MSERGFRVLGAHDHEIEHAAASAILDAMAFAQVRVFRDNARPHCGAAGHPGKRPHLAGVAEWQTQRTQNPPLATA